MNMHRLRREIELQNFGLVGVVHLERPLEKRNATLCQCPLEDSKSVRPRALGSGLEKTIIEEEDGNRLFSYPR
jgi:hypothetical protein